MNQSKNTQIIIGLAVVLILAVAGYMYLRPDVAEPYSLQEGFSYGLGDWKKDSDVPMDPNNQGNMVAWNITHIEDMTNPSNGIVRFFIDGSQDDGTIWLEREIMLEPNTEYTGELSFRFYSESESFNQIAAVVAYLGIDDPEAEGDFDVLGPANEVEGWKTYTHAVTLSTDSNGNVWVGCGISVRWETEMIYMIDDISLELN